MSLKHITQPSSVSRRKSASKRPLVHSDDDDALATSTSQRTKRPRTTDTDASLSVATTPDSSNDMDVDADVDIDTFRDSAQRSLSAADDSRFLPDDPQRLPPRVDASKKRKKPAVAKKKSQVLYSDEDAHTSHVERDLVDDVHSALASPLSEMSDDDFELDGSSKHGTFKAKASAAKTKAGKAKSGLPKGGKAKAPKEKEKEKEKDREMCMKDERKLTVPPVTTSRGSSAAAQSQLSDLFSNEDLAPSSAVDAVADVSQSLGQTILKKRKLPPIKKTKTTTGTTSSSTPTQKTALPPAHAQELPKPLLPVSEQRKQALTGVRDVDLADSRVYAELFKGAGGNTPKSGLKNAEERRKELDRMRDEARARRAEEMKFTFDLQAQADKIARFEQRLHVENSTVLHPNFLAAKFRDEWEMERRARRATPKEEGEA